MADQMLAAHEETAATTTHTITFGTPTTAGYEVLVVGVCAAVVSLPAGGWVFDKSFIDGAHQFVLRLPGASNPGGLTGLALSTSAARRLTAVAWETDGAGGAPTYGDADDEGANDGFKSTNPSAPVSAGTLWGTGLHTFAAGYGVAVFWGNQTDANPDASQVVSVDTGTLIGSAHSPYGGSGDEGGIVAVAVTGPMSNNGVTATLSPAMNPDGILTVAAERNGFLAYDLISDTTPPALQSRSPGVDATEVAVDTAVVLTFDEALGGTPAVALSPVVAGSLDNTNGVLTFTPDADLADSTTYTVTASGIEDTSGNTAADVSWSFTTTAGGVTWGATIADEIAIPGAPAQDWTISGNGDYDTLGFTRSMSHNPGDTVDFALHSSATVDIDIYRIGGYDTGWRFIERIANTPTTQPAAQAIADSNGATECSGWSTTASWTVPAGAWSGLYVAVPRAVPGPNASYIPFIVRDDSRDADIVVKASDTTWALAYNTYGTPGAEDNGKSVYGIGPGIGAIGDRAYAVSLDRPILTRGGVPLTYWMNGEMPLWRYLDKQGFSWKLISSLDLDAGLTAVGNAKVLVSAGHDEYWSQGMRDNAEAFRDAGGHLVFMSGNEMLWRVRFSPDRRTMWCYKDTMNNGVQIDPVTWTGTWRDTRWVGSEPENLLTGTFFRMNNTGTDYAITVDAATYGSSPFWRGTTVETGPTDLTLTGVVGFEADAHDTPPGATASVLLANATINVDGFYADDNGQNYDGNGDLVWGINLMRVGPSIVAGFGTVQWTWSLDPVHENGRHSTNVEDTQAKQAIINLLTDMGAVASTPTAGLVAPTAVDFAAYGLAEPTTAGFRVSDGAMWWTVPGGSEVKSDVKAIAAASADFADFQSRMAAW